MAKKTTSTKGKVTARKPPPVRRMRIFKPITFYERRDDPAALLVEIYHEMGRLGVRDHELHEYHRDVLRNVGSWLSEHPGEAYAKMTNWLHLDLEKVAERFDRDRTSKPRIELCAEITKKRNLTVRWYPRGWHEGILDLTKRPKNPFNLIEQYRFPEPPDFVWFEGDEPATFQGRASNELMFIRGVGSLDPQPEKQYGQYATYNFDVMSANLLGLVCAAYNALIEQLSCAFDVTVIDRFEVETRPEIDEGDPLSSSFPTDRPVSWKIVTTNPPRIGKSGDVVPFSPRGQ